VPAVNAGAAQAWFIAGTVVAMLGAGAHALLALVDTVRPTFFAPIESSASRGMNRSGMRLVRMFGRSGARPSIWRVWLGINIGVGLGVFGFALLSLLIATYEFELVERIGPIGPLAVAFSAAFLVLSLRFWFYLPALICATATACFTVAMVLSA
jgi:hypothetical protein